ncbi:MAG: hypothetical protein WCG60_01945 [bacterium]
MLLQDKMDRLGYKDLPTLHIIDLDKLGQRLAGMGMVDKTAWDSMSSVMLNGSFYASLSMFKDKILDLISLTATLNTTIDNLRLSADKGCTNVVLEENLPGSLRADFARLYSSWNIFHREFLASSILSAEVWYASGGFTSITGDKVPMMDKKHYGCLSNHEVLVH